MKAGEIFVTQLPNAGTARRKAKRLLGNSIALSRLKLSDGAEEPLLQFHLHVRADLLWISAGSDAADDVEPILLRKIYNRAGTVNERLGGNRNPEGGGISKAVAKESGRRDADHGERLAVQSYRASDNRGIAAELLLPRPIADHRDRRRAFAIVFGGYDPAGIRANAKHRKVVSGNEFASHRTRRFAGAGAAYADEIVSCLEGGEFGEAGRVIAKHFVLVVGEERPIVLKTAIHAAIFHIAHAIQFARLGHRQGIQQHRMHQCEDRCSCANSKRESQDGGNGKNRCVDELPQCVAYVFHRFRALVYSIRIGAALCSLLFVVRVAKPPDWHRVRPS